MKNEETARGNPRDPKAPSARHMCSSAPKSVASSVRSSIFYSGCKTPPVRNFATKEAINVYPTCSNLIQPNQGFLRKKTFLCGGRRLGERARVISFFFQTRGPSTLPYAHHFWPLVFFGGGHARSASVRSVTPRQKCLKSGKSN